jgi:uncharacterized protein
MSGEAGLLLLAWPLARWLDVAPLQKLGPAAPAFLWGSLATLPLLVGLAWMLASPSKPIRKLVGFVVEQIGPLLAPLSWLELALLAAVAGLSEEILFRGVIQVALTAWLTPGWALLITAILFGLVHFASPTYALFAGAMGVYLGLLFLTQGNLLTPVVTHSLYDFVALIAVARRYRDGAAAGALTPFGSS